MDKYHVSKTISMVLFGIDRSNGFTLTKNDPGHQDGWGYIPSSYEDFIEAMDVARKAVSLMYKDWASQKFIDVGCGNGMKMQIANQLGLNDVWGLEYDKRLIKISNRLFNRKFAEKIIHGDALEFNDYWQYDIVYFYCPLKEFERQVELETRVYEQAPDGTVLIQFLKNNRDARMEPDLYQIGDQVFMKATSKKTQAVVEMIYPGTIERRRRQFVEMQEQTVEILFSREIEPDIDDEEEEEEEDD